MDRPGEPERCRPGVPARGPGEPVRLLAGVPDLEGEPVRLLATALSGPGRLPPFCIPGGDAEPGAPGLWRPLERARAGSSPPHPGPLPGMLGRRCIPLLLAPTVWRFGAAVPGVAPPLSAVELLEPASRRGDCRMDASVRAVVTEELLVLPMLPGPCGVPVAAAALATAAAAAPAPARANCPARPAERGRGAGDCRWPATTDRTIGAGPAVGVLVPALAEPALPVATEPWLALASIVGVAAELLTRLLGGGPSADPGCPAPGDMATPPGPPGEPGLVALSMGTWLKALTG